MSRLFSSHRFCSRYFLLTTTRSKPQQADRVFIQARQRGYTGGLAACKHRPKSKVWMCGVGVGIVLAVGLKYGFDSADSSCEDKVKKAKKASPYIDAIKVSRDLLERIKAEVGAPGLVAGVSVDGVQVWSEGFGYADLENRVPCTSETLMRIASISKPLTTAAAARLCQEGKLDLDVPVQKYVPEFPQKQFDGRDVTITPRMLLSHLSGIRHYEKDPKKVKEDREKAKRLLKPPAKDKEEDKNSSENKDEPTADQNSKCKKSSPAKRKKAFDHEEYYLKNKFESVLQALDLFKDDPLIFKPGTTFLYSTHAFTLLSAVLERAAGQSFLDVMMNMFRELGMLNTVPDENEPILYHRSRFYHVSKRGRVVNCPYVDNSYKWAGGGFLSTVGDLLLFGNALLYSYQVAHFENEGLLPGFLQPKTATELWAPVDKTEASWDKDGLYAQGWLVVEKLQKYGQCRERSHYVSHTGGAVGASSVLLVLPSEDADQRRGPVLVLPQGVVVTIITNMQSVGLNATALKIAREFEKARNK
ncbi:serine beta-lactamase-like protein LACTB, mitochondrial isoform X2 [Kryptolebias marmoratus]|uniref:Lactamase, beta n=1 Tax=Kryptolebias marmoratus TaxID=37003 RepID=A0A3Q3B316_KRYMA|nr:serine beta-lactamase-like protein LACTB, mitochondrial isoform X2 [Kryptolebias marmoratus]